MNKRINAWSNLHSKKWKSNGRRKKKVSCDFPFKKRREIIL